jgi:hypothetical protein
MTVRAAHRPIVTSAQNRAKNRNPAQAILPARAHFYGSATHNRCELPIPRGCLGPTIKEQNHEHEILTGGIAARPRDVNYS